MTLTKNRMVREIGRRTRLKNRDIQAVLETLVEVWTEELVNGGRIELENFIVLETKTIDRGEHVGILKNKSRELQAPRFIRRLIVRTSRNLKRLLSEQIPD